MTFEVDEKVKSLGIANHDKRLLEKCIELLNNNDKKKWHYLY